MEAHRLGMFIPELTERLRQLSVMEASYTTDDGICEDDSWVESSVEMHPILSNLRQYELQRLLRETIKNNDYGLDFNPVYTSERNTEPEYNNPHFGWSIFHTYPDSELHQDTDKTQKNTKEVTQEETLAKSSESDSINNGVPENHITYDFNKVLEQMNKTMMAKT